MTVKQLGEQLQYHLNEIDLHLTRNDMISDDITENYESMMSSYHLKREKKRAKKIINQIIKKL